MAVTPALSQVVEALDATGWAIEVLDERWNVVWASSEMRLILGAEMGADLGLDRHVVESRRLTAFDGIGVDSSQEWLAMHVPWMLHDGAEAADLGELVDARHREAVGAMTPQPPPLRWSFRLDARALGPIQALGERLHDEDGRFLGTIFVYGSTLPASVLSIVARGDVRMFRRMTELTTPGRRSAAILFADIEGSTDRSRRLPSARYFEHIVELNTAIDEAILGETGIVGKHAGDGVSAFFLADQVGSISGAARAAIGAARSISRAAASLDGDWRINTGVHWGATLYMGRIATSGRLEVTALGDEVNECARIQESAGSGRLLASKALLERLEPADAAALDLDPGSLRYALVGELPGASDKARRDAATLAVAELPLR
jgi:class 3 adenylate cyclase